MMDRRHLGGTLLAALVCAVTVAAAPLRAPQGQWAEQIDGVFKPWRGNSSPGCAVGVYKDGRIIFERGYGRADLEHDVPIDADSVFYVGSVSKQFTAFAAALAIQQGRMSPDDSIRKFLPELPPYADAITVRHLIHHTSGLRDYNTLLAIAGRRGDEAYDNLTVLRITARQNKLNFSPGDEYLYSNTGYTLLATIVERATGTPFAAFAAARIFEPLGMKATHYHVDAGRLVKRRALAYAEGSDGGWRLDTPSNERAGAGGLYTSVRDLVRWDENFYHPTVGNEALIRQVQTPGRLNDGAALTYAWGLQIGSYHGKPVVEHGGALGGYRAHLMRFPEEHLSVTALCNLGSIIPSRLVRQVADAVIGSRFTEPPAPTAAGEADGGGRRTDAAPTVEQRSTAKSDYGGTFYSNEIDATFTVTLKGDTLMLQRDSDLEAAPLDAGADGAFRLRGMAIRFEHGSDGSVGALIVDAGRVRDIRFARTTAMSHPR
jgi:CubicO group peptidase (beta-lactamase class C family)